MMHQYVTYQIDGTLDGAFIQMPPEDHAGRAIDVTDEQYANWTAYRANDARDGVELLPPAPPAPPAVPQEVTRRQARQALLLDGLLDKVAPAIAAIDDPLQRGLAQIEWEDSQSYERQRPILISLGRAIGLDDTALDDLFIKAGGL